MSDKEQRLEGRSKEIPLSDDELADHLTSLGEKLLQMGRSLSGEQSNTENIATHFNDSVLAAIALSIHRARQRRTRYFSSDLLGEPAWDILLDLFVNRVRGIQVASTSLCLASGVPISTATRTIRHLEGQGLLFRHPASDDKRLTLVEITETGFRLMRTYLSEGVLRDEMPLPEGVVRN